MKLLYLFLLVGPQASHRGKDLTRRAVGMFVGLVIRATGLKYIQERIKFDYQVFFNVLLPPIILNSGYELHQVCYNQR